MLYGAGAWGGRVTFAAGGIDRALRLSTIVVRPRAYRVIDTGTSIAASIRFHPEGTHVLAQTGEGTVQWPLLDMAKSDSLPLPGGWGRAAYTPDGRHAGAGKSLVQLANPDRPKTEFAGGSLDIAFSEDGRFAATLTRDVNIWDRRTLERVHTFRPGPTPNHQIATVSFSPDGRLVAAGTFESNSGKLDALGSVTIWSLETGQKIRELPGENCGIWRLAWSPDGTRLAVASGVHLVIGKGTAKVWDTRTWELVYELKGHTECVWGVAFTPDGRRLATCCGGFERKRVKTSGEIKLWDMETGLELLSLCRGGATIYDVSFSSDGRWFGAAGADGKLRIWDLRPDQGAMAMRSSHQNEVTPKFKPD